VADGKAEGTHLRGPDHSDRGGAVRYRGGLELGDIAARLAPLHPKAEYALGPQRWVRAGVDPGFLDEVSWWRTDDMWFWALQALVTDVRAAAEHGSESVPATCGQVASRHGLQLAAAT
jgi:hypothetical protein